MKWVFWISAAVLAYTYFGYLFWLYLRSRLRPRPVHSASFLPPISLVMAVHNEEQWLPEKLSNLAELNYPDDRKEIIVISDGSTDSTNQILASQENEFSRVIFTDQQRGKACALNQAIQAARGEIVVFTDARQLIEPQALLRLIANFADPAVGCVSGELILRKRETSDPLDGVGLYWRLEKKIRKWESATSSVVGATGALYAARRRLLVPLPPGTILDDVFIPLEIARQGYRVIFESAALVWDSLSSSASQEFRRKVRTLTGNYQLLQLQPWLLTSRNPVRFEFVSHKLLRLFAPFLLATALISALLLTGGVYRLAGVLQLAFYGLGALALFHVKVRPLGRIPDAVFAFLLLNTAAVLALINFLMGRKQVWAR
jgi:biofilm PGA synthesis N-glycosyltransferase PgaC